MPNIVLVTLVCLFGVFAVNAFIIGMIWLDYYLDRKELRRIKNDPN